MIFASATGLNGLLEDDESFDDSDDNPLLQYCFSEHYGDNFGVRTLMEYDEECTIGESCLANGTTIELEGEVLRHKRGNLMNDCRQRFFYSIDLNFHKLSYLVY